MNSRITLYITGLFCTIPWDSKASGKGSHTIFIATLERDGFGRQKE